MINTRQPIKSKRFTITVSPEYQGGRLLVLTHDEAKRFARDIMLDAEINDPNDTLLKWAEEVYFG